MEPKNTWEGKIIINEIQEKQKGGGPKMRGMKYVKEYERMKKG